ncbi:MAG: carboxypeptidase-like regulatory domain-containing protein, partial [Planctomycetota bacterium]
AEEPIAVEGIAAGCTTMGELRERFERGELKDPEQVLRNTPTAAWPWVRSAADGSFELGGLEERNYRLRAMDPATLLMVEQDRVAAGSKDARLVLEQADLFTTLRGIVVSSRGEPVAGVRVQAQIDTLRTGGATMHNRSEAQDTTDAEGRFTLPNVPKHHVYLRLDGESILPVEYGRGVAGGLLELSNDRPDVRIEVGVRVHLQVELLAPTSADTIAVLDAAGKTVIINVFSGRSRSETDELSLADGKSPVFVVPDSAATLVLSKAGKEVRREVLQLHAGGVNTLQL